MGHRLVGQRRFCTGILAGLLLAVGVSSRVRYSASTYAAATNPSVPSLELDTVPRADRVAIGADDAAQAIEDTDESELIALQQKFEGVGKRAAPAVVSISAAETASDIDAMVRSDEMNPQRLQTVLDKTTRTIGTGFIVASDGFIVTNEHVIEDSQQFWVTTDDHKVYPAIVVGADPRGDLAVMKIPAAHLPTVQFSTMPCQRGQWAVTMGNPYGLATEGQMALSVGVVSATDRSLPRLANKEDRLYSNLIQTTAQINPGNSGGPLLDLDGRVIGIDTAVILPQKQTNGIGFALPITNDLLIEIKQLEQGREMVYGYVGVTVAAMTWQQRRDAALAEPIGVCVESVEAGSPAAAVLRVGDVLVQMNGEKITDTDHFVRMVGAAPVGRTSAIGIIRDRKRMMVNLVPVKRPVPYAVCKDNQRMYWRGMVLGPVPANWPLASSNEKHRAGILVVGIQDDSPLKKQGLCAGMVITAIAGRPVGSMMEVQRVLNDVPPEQCSVETAADVTEVLAVGK
jgi:serine protease Do